MPDDARPSLLFELLAPPWRRFEIVSHNTPAEVAAALQSATEARRYFRMPFSETRDFEGVVYGDSFAVSRIIRYRNSLRPLITGRVEPMAGGTRIAIGMRPAWFALGGIITIVAVVVATVLLTQSALGGLQTHSAGLWIAAAVLAGCYLTISVPFGLEARWAREILLTILHGEEAPQIAGAYPASIEYPRTYRAPLPPRALYLTELEMRRRLRIRRAFIAYVMVVAIIGFGAFFYFSAAYGSGATHPAGSQSAALTNHGKTVYVTPRQKFVADTLMTLMFGGIISVMLGGLIIDRMLGVPLFSNPPRHPGIGQ